MDIWFAIVRIIKVLVTIAWAALTAIVLISWHLLKGMFKPAKK